MRPQKQLVLLKHKHLVAKAYIYINKMNSCANLLCRTILPKITSALYPGAHILAGLHYMIGEVRFELLT